MSFHSSYKMFNMQSKLNLTSRKESNNSVLLPKNKTIVSILIGSLTLFMLILGQLNGSLGEVGSNNYKNPNQPIEARVEDLLSRMTLEEKVGQMTQIDHRYLSRNHQEIWQDHLGSLLAGGGGAPYPNTPKKWAKTLNLYQRLSIEETRLGIPLLLGTDSVHGHSNLKGAVIFPHQIGLGATWNPELVENCARITAVETGITGINWTFSPIADVARDDRWGRTYGSFGEDPYLAKTMVRKTVVGYQGKNAESLRKENRIIACAKHYLAYGGTSWGTGKNSKIDRGNAELENRIIRERHFPSFKAAVNENVRTIMSAFNTIRGVEVEAWDELLTGWLKEELGFKGFIVSDWGSIDDAAPTYKEAIQIAINSGIDMVMVPDYNVTKNHHKFQQYMLELVKDGKISENRINDAVRRILRVKFQLNLFEDPYVDTEEVKKRIGTDSHRAVARQAVRESQVLLKNNGVLPLKENADIFVTGPNANNLGYQCGGWTINWQGGDGNITEGTSILEGIKNEASGPVTFSEEASNAEGHDVAIVVVGEKPYAEYEGDTDNLSLPREHLNLIEEVTDTETPTVVIMVAGRPRTGITSQLSEIDAFLMSWLPGSEGQGVSDVLFGDYNPSGELPRSYPRSTNQEPINYDHRPEENYDPLFRFGYGLSYTNFEYSNLRVVPNPVKKIEDNVQIKINITNTGDITGSEPVQVYVNDVHSTLSTPVKKLYRFKKIKLKPSETKTVNFTIPVKELGFYANSYPERIVENGTFQVLIGNLKKSFNVKIQSKGPEFEFNDLTVNDNEVEVGKKVKISVKIKNSSAILRVKKIELLINGEIADSQSVELLPKEHKKISFDITGNREGTCQIGIAGLSKSVRFVKPTSEGDKEKSLLLAGVVLSIAIITAIVYYWKVK